ncbi:hypothetical protein [uncultured Kordia sp.]|uniref:hypothetical protein n=1 Tax=uncultured Kordia sp. TaxID=507699 RepID=UPI0026104754|nr:hypothetical protein [uncultured Kordia sp.]
MKKLIFKARYFALVLSMIVGALYITSCQTDEITSEQEETAISKDLEENQRSIPNIADFSPPRIPNPNIDEHCVVRLAYLSYLERCPENASVVSYWIGVLNRENFGGLAKGFITSPEANQRWNTRYHQFLNRNNINSSQISKKVYIAYRGLLLREPDVNGGIYWTNIERATNILTVANGIGNSAEFNRRRNGFPTECANAANQCPF